MGCTFYSFFLQTYKNDVDDCTFFKVVFRDILKNQMNFKLVTYNEISTSMINMLYIFMLQ